MSLDRATGSQIDTTSAKAATQAQPVSMLRRANALCSAKISHCPICRPIFFVAVKVNIKAPPQ
jgi:hypothetical protein